jgi:hypothetical protein
MPAQILVSFQEVRVLRRLHRDAGTSVRRIAAVEIIGFPLVRRILHDSHFTHTTSSKYKPSVLMTINQGWCFAIGFSQNAL